MRDLYPLIRETHFKYLVKWGLIRPVTRTNTDTYVGFADVAVIKEISDAMTRGCTFRAAVRQRLADRLGQLSLNFGAGRSDARPAKVVALRRREVTKAVVPADAAWTDSGGQGTWAARFFLEGAELDEGDEADRERARVAYRKALLLDPTLVPAIVNLANLHYANDDLVEAQALYGRALTLEPDCFEAHFNLGNIHHDLGRFDEALAFYHDALRSEPAVRRRALLPCGDPREDGLLGGLQDPLAAVSGAGAGWGVGGAGARVQRLTSHAQWGAISSRPSRRPAVS